MKALRYNGSLQLVTDLPVPRRDGEALVKVLIAGICNTDLEITRGYAGFTGTLGHEFVGRVVESPDGSLLHSRVAGEINVGCQVCADCHTGDARHCKNRTVLGIKGRDGAFAEYLTLPLCNLLELPDSISNEEAVFVEPLAAACNILEQVEVDRDTQVAVIGDGKLAQLIVRALGQTGCYLALVGKHPEKLKLANPQVSHLFRPSASETESLPVLPQTIKEKFDVVIEASGSPSGLPIAVQLVRPRGIIVLKSTHHRPTSLDLSSVVVNEITITGSRCGRFHRAVEVLEQGTIQVAPLISGQYSLDQGVLAFARASEPDALKILLRVADD
jgi:threonine dehydrogenase-like Zn-dependent dehydrogenase